ncbi:MAG TPA: helix-turn-helix domain-containing protein [Longilinea sp.]|nr:helix-turn-helix domain-containing protein [Longilinea sp.]
MPDRKTRKQLITAQRQEQILKAALEVFAQKGFAAATVPEIAKRAGVASGTIYLYYPSKRELFAAVVEMLLITPLLNLFQEQADQEFPSTFMNVIQARLAILQSDFLTRLLSLTGEIQRDTELKVLFSEKLIQPFFSQMEDLFRPRMMDGELRPVELSITVRLIASLMLGSNLVRSLEGESSPLNRLSQDEQASVMMDFVLNGLLNKANMKETKGSHES